MAERSDLVRELLSLARDDRAAAEAMLGLSTVSDSIVGFHAQQAVEKALKAALAASGVDFPFTHDLAVLVDLCQDAGLILPESLAEGDRLSPYGVRFRYGAAAAVTVDRETAQQWAQIAVAWAQAHVGASTG